LVLAYGVTEEVPLGRVDGKLTMKENGRPLPEALVTLTPIGKSEDDEPVRPRAVESRTDGTFSLRDVPAGDYRVHVSAKVHSLPKTFLRVEEGKAVSSSLVLAPADPTLQLYSSQRVFTPGETPEVEMHGFMETDDIRVEVRRVDMAEAARNGGLEETLSPLANPEARKRIDLAKRAPLVRELQHRVTKKDAEGSFIEPLTVGDLPEGVYLVSCSGGDKMASTSLIVSRIALVAKSDDRRTLCYAMDLKTGMPVAGVDVSVHDKGSLRQLGRTGADGTVDAPLPAGDGRRVIVGRQGASTALVGYYSSQPSNPNVRITGYLERPVYRPGDQVRFKGIARRVAEQGYRLPGGGTAEVEVRDPDDNVIERLQLPVSSHGTFHGAFTPSAEAKPGSYRVGIRAQGAEHSLYANIAAYRKPEYSVSIRPTKEFFVLGDRASATVQAEYYFGGPVVGAEVRATVYRSPAWTYEDEDGEQYESGGAGEFSQEVIATTDPNGRATITFDTRAANDPSAFDTDYVYTVSASVKDEGGKYFDGEGKVRLVRGDHDLRVEVERQVVRPGENVDVVVRTTSVIDKERPVSGREVRLQVGREEWTERESVFVPRATYAATTGPDGTARIQVPADRSGTLVLKAISTDGANRPVTATGNIYVEGSEAFYNRAEESPLTVILDRKQYAIGGEARVLIRTGKPGGSALVTVQSERMIEQRVVPLTQSATLVTLPVSAECAPNAFVSVAYVREKKFHEANRRLAVEQPSHKLQVTVTPEKAEYQPGQTARVRVRTADAAGKAVPAEISLAVVDEGIYAIREDDTDLAEALYPRRQNLVQTNHSFPEIYLDGGDKGTSNVPLRTKFRDTAHWAPQVWTGPTGETVVEVPLPDNLTSWRATAVGISDGSAVGKSKSNFRARKDLMVRLQLPTYLVDGDEQRTAVIVTNDTPREQEVNVEVGAQGVGMDGEPRRSLRLKANSSESLEFALSARGSGVATLTARAWVDGGPSDGVQQQFPIKPHAHEVVNAQAGETKGAVTIALPILATSDPNQGKLALTLSPTLAGSLVSSLDGLVGFPYGCVEQTMSRFMPSVIVSQTLRELGLRRPELEARIPKIAADGFARLGRMQSGSGGWGWFEYDQPDPFMTALVLDGLDRAKRAGYQSSSIKLESALEWAQNRVQSADGKKDPVRTQVYLAYVLARHGRTAPATAVVQGLDLSKAGADSVATAALTFHELNMVAPRDAAMRQLERSAQGETGVASWPGGTESYGEEANALVLTLFATAEPNNPIVPRIVRGMIARRKGALWQSTRDTSYSLIGLSTYLRQSKELAGRPEVTVTINGRPWKRVTLDPSAATPEVTLEIPRSELPVGSSRVGLQTNGDGTCYYTAELRQFDVRPEFVAESPVPGLTIERKVYRLESRRLESGTMRLLPSARPVDEARPGDILRVELTIQTDMPREFLLIEEPTPSNCRVMEREEIGEYEEWSYWWSRTVVRDDRVAFFARSMPAGTHKIQYQMRAEGPGVGSSLPAVLANMYDPGQRASSAETRLKVTP